MATGRASEGSVEQGPAWGTEVSELAAMGSSRTSRAIGRAEWGGGAPPSYPTSPTLTEISLSCASAVPCGQAIVPTPWA